MTEPTNFELLELATPYALHAVSAAERADIDRQVAAAASPVATAFADEVRAVCETMAIVSAATAAEPPTHLRAAILALAQPAKPDRQSHWRTTILASAASAIAAVLTAVGIHVLTRPSATPTVAEQIMTAPDVRTVSRPLSAGTATVVFSHQRHAGVLVMNNVTPPSPGTVYQMWLINGQSVTSAGTMDAKAVSPSTTAVLSNIGDSTALAFTVEPGSGSTHPTGQVLVVLPLT